MSSYSSTPPIDPAVIRSCLDHFIAGLIEIRDELLRAEQAAAHERRLVAQAEVAALRDLAAAADGSEPE